LHELLVNVIIALSPDDVAIMKEGHPEVGTPLSLSKKSGWSWAFSTDWRAAAVQAAALLRCTAAHW